MQQEDLMPIYPAVEVVTVAGCILAPCGTPLVPTRWLSPEGSVAGLAQHWVLAPQSGFFDGAEAAVLPLAPAQAPWVLSQKSLHPVPGHGTDTPLVSLPQNWARVAGVLGMGRCLRMVFCRQMQLYSVLWAVRASASTKPGTSLLGWIVHRADHSCTAPGSLLAWIHPDSETEWVLTYRQNTTQTNPDIHGI